MKLCPKCGTTKPLASFSSDKRAKDGKLAVCKPCRAAYIRVWNKANTESNRARSAAWAKANPKRTSARKLAWQRANRGVCNSRNAQYKTGKLQAYPAWANKKYMELWYKFSKMEEARTGRKCHVDHIVPLRSKLVCGLHCEHNMQILFDKENCSKGNYHWPEMP